MKKFGFLLVALLALWACSDDDTTPQQEVTCSITAPAEGTVIDLATAASMTIKGEGAVNVGKIESVVLKVNGKLVSEVTKVPFSYDYAFPADQAVGEMKIELTVKGDAGKEKAATANVTLKKTETEPEPEPEPEQEVTCEITAPASGATFDLASVTELNISGKAAVNVGAIETFALKVDGVEIVPVPVLADDGTFSHTYSLANKSTGELSIELAVKGDKTATAKTASVVITLTRTVAPPTGDTFTDERDGHVYKYVTIGTQSWMADNLAYLPEVNDPSAEQDGCTGNPLYFVLNYQGSDLAAAKATKEYKNYGVLYNWWAAMGKQNATGGDANAVPSGVQGVCPNGWHLPSRAEWKVLEEYVASQLPNVDGNGMYSDYGTALEHDCRNVWGALASQIGWGATSMGEEGPELLKGGQDTYGMHIIPSGNVSHIADYYGNWFKETDKAVDFWLTDLIDNGGDDYNNYWAATINWSVDNKDYRPKYSTYGTRTKMGLSVRCVKD